MWYSMQNETLGSVDMLAIERKNEILSKLRAEQRVLVSELAVHYQVTEETIRRDLDKLEKEGYATKTYGGAIWGNSTKTDLSYTIRNKTNVEAKNTIAGLVSDMVEDGDHLMLDDSSTSLYVAKRLKEKKDLTVITNSVELVVELSGMESWTIMLTGGRLKRESLALVGSQTQEMLHSYHVDKVILSCKGIDREAGITDSSEFHSQTKQAMLHAAKKRILILDGTKFDKISFVEISPLSSVDTVVTNTQPSQDWLDYFESAGIECIYPKNRE
jgi:DeoR/GlpR family transcriptional regulator of sugar metabolism